MSEKMTSIHLPGERGLRLYGAQSRESMIQSVRDHAKHEVEKWQSYLDAKDEDFRVRIVRGRKTIKEL